MRRGLALVLLAGTASADPRLRLTHEPPPRTLRMRPRVAQAGSAQPTTVPPTAPAPIAPPSTGEDPGGAAIRDFARPVSFSIDLGYQVDAASPSGRSSLATPAVRDGVNYAAVRSYGFGEVYGSTRGLGLTSLSSYFAARFQAARSLDREVTGLRVDLAPPIATWFERSGLDIRAAWAEMRDFLPRAWGMSRLRVRAGSQYVYGPWMMHVDGLLVSYDGPILTASGYGGYRHSDYTREQSDKRPRAGGASLRVDLRGLPTPLPIALQAELLRLGESEEAMQPASTSSVLQADWRPRQDVAMIGQLRFLNGRSANQRLEIRARYKQVTNVVLNVMHRTADDWAWDPSLTAPQQEPAEARRYLDLGPVVPQLIASARAGTLIAENVDLLLRGAVSVDTGDEDDPVSAFAQPYLEAGGALEVRVRRQIALGASLLTRTTERLVVDPRLDMHPSTQPLPPTEATGEEGFTEAGASIRMTLGARRFSSLVEVYGRRTRFAPLYVDPLLPIPEDDVRLGGRVTLDAWVGTRVRLFAAYDASSTLELAPEITGYRSLRLMMSGVY